MVTYNGNDVYLDKKHIGTIKKADGGYRYVPKGQKDSNGGEIFSSIAAVKITL